MDSNYFYYKFLFFFNFDYFNFLEFLKNVLMNILFYLNVVFLNKMCIKIIGIKLDNFLFKNEIFFYMYYNVSYLYLYSIL